MSEGFTCRGCGNFFFQAPKCVGCGAEKLYDSTVRLQGKEIEYQAARIAQLEAALADMAKHVWRGDWDKLKPETRELLGEQK
jgi:hypothetical protein